MYVLKLLTHVQRYYLKPPTKSRRIAVDCKTAILLRWSGMRTFGFHRSAIVEVVKLIILYSPWQSCCHFFCLFLWRVVKIKVIWICKTWIHETWICQSESRFCSWLCHYDLAGIEGTEPITKQLSFVKFYCTSQCHFTRRQRLRVLIFTVIR